MQLTHAVISAVTDEKRCPKQILNQGVNMLFNNVIGNVHFMGFCSFWNYSPDSIFQLQQSLLGSKMLGNYLNSKSANRVPVGLECKPCYYRLS